MRAECRVLRLKSSIGAPELPCRRSDVRRDLGLIAVGVGAFYGIRANRKSFLLAPHRRAARVGNGWFGPKPLFMGSCPSHRVTQYFVRRPIRSLATLVNRESSESKRTSEAIASAVLWGGEDRQCAKLNGRNRAPPWSECSEYRTTYEPVGMDPGSISNKRKASCPIRCNGT